jgi:ABC-type lipoprotein release transport system permease subunit
MSKTKTWILSMNSNGEIALPHDLCEQLRVNVGDWVRFIHPREGKSLGWKIVKSAPPTRRGQTKQMARIEPA